MRVELWTDIICPWCGLGSHLLETALARFGHQRDVELVRRSFVLDESFPVGVTQPVMDVLRSRKGLTEGQARQVTREIEVVAEHAGLKPYRVLDNIDRRSAVRGAWSVDALVQALEAAWRDGGSPRTPVLGEGTECGPDGCVVPVGNDLQSARVR